MRRVVRRERRESFSGEKDEGKAEEMAGGKTGVKAGEKMRGGQQGQEGKDSRERRRGRGVSAVLWSAIVIGVSMLLTVTGLGFLLRNFEEVRERQRQRCGEAETEQTRQS